MIEWFNYNQGFVNAILALLMFLVSAIAIIISLKTSRRQNTLSVISEYSPIINIIRTNKWLTHRLQVTINHFIDDDYVNFLNIVEGFCSHNNFYESLKELQNITTQSEYLLNKSSWDILMKMCYEFAELSDMIYFFREDYKNKDKKYFDYREKFISNLSKYNRKYNKFYDKMIKNVRK